MYTFTWKLHIAKQFAYYLTLRWWGLEISTSSCIGWIQVVKINAQQILKFTLPNVYNGDF